MQKKLSVSFVYDDSLDGSEGVAQYVKNLGSWLSTQGHSVAYLVGQTLLKEYNGAPIYSLSKNISIKFNGNKLTVPLYSSKRRIRSILKSTKPDVIHIQMPYSPLMGQKVVAEAHKRSTIIGTFHIFPANRFVNFGSRLLRILYGDNLQLIDHTLSVSQPAKDFAKDAFKIRSSISSNMVDTSMYAEARAASHKETKQSVVFVGRLVERKGCSYLIKAFAAVAKNHPETKLLIAGNGPEKFKLINLAERLGASDQVEFLGFVSEQRKAELLASARIACFPSLFGESFGIVLIEAMAAGASVVLGGDNPGYRSVLKDPRSLFDPKDIIVLSEKLEHFLEDTNDMRELHKLQQEDYVRYDINVVGRKIEEVYYQQIAKTANRRHN